MKAHIYVTLGLMVLSSAIQGAPKNGMKGRRNVNMIPSIPRTDPWLIPKSGVLVSEHTPIYEARRGFDDELYFYEVPDAMKLIAQDILNRTEYRKAYAEDISKKNDFIQIKKNTTQLPKSRLWPKILYPEIMVVVAYDLYRIFRENIWEVIPYVLAFWNGVDMMYRGFENPEIRINIAGIILETKYNILDYIEYHPTDYMVLKTNTLYKASKFWYKHRNRMPLENYDELVTMTTREICLHSNGTCISKAQGQSWSSQICSDHPKKARTKKVAIVYDNGKFGGIVAATDGLGHALGMKHDGLTYGPKDDLTDLPNCANSTFGYIMGFASSTAPKVRWSQCSIEYLEKFINTHNSTCLYNKPPVGRIHIPRLLPGKLATLDEQCKAYGYGKSCSESTLNCISLKCEESDQNDTCESRREAPVETSPCDRSDPTKFCMFGECVSESEFVVAVEAPKNHVRAIPHTLAKDPWLTPKEGILVTEHTTVYLAKRRNTDEVKFSEIPGMMEKVAAHLLSEEKYRNASVENINNPNNYPIPNPTVPTSVPGQWPEIMYPEILVVIAHDLYQKLGSDLMKAIPYVLAFWNGVDMMYRSIENPKIRFHIVGIIFETEYGVFDYLMNEYQQERLITSYTLHEARRFWYKHRDQIPLESYDDVVALTTRPICHSNYGECEPAASGKTWVSSMCLDDAVNKGTYKVSILQDDGKFSGIQVASHELGHALGMKHDPYERFKPDEELKDLPNCRNVSSGYIMFPFVAITAYEQRWSECSLDQLEKFIQTKNPTCLYNPPVPGKIHIPRLLPGKLVSLNDQCQAGGFDAVSDSYFQPCQLIECRRSSDPNRSIESNSLVGLEGTPCDKYNPNSFCMLGKCVSEAAFT